MRNECNCTIVWTFCGIGMKTDLLQFCAHCWIFHICWHIECSNLISMDKKRKEKTFTSCPMLTILSFFLPFYFDCIGSLLGCPVAQTVKNLSVMQETQVQSLGQEDLLAKRMVTYSSILDWRIPWTEEPGRLQSIGYQRVGHNWANVSQWVFVAAGGLFFVVHRLSLVAASRATL